MDSATYESAFERWFLSVTVPYDVPAETYGLEVTASGGIYDEVDHAVTVRQSIESDFYFIHITDTHLPTHKYYYESGADTDTTEMEDLHAVIDDINIINPAFVLLTGDVINEGELEDYLNKRYFTRTQRILQRFDVPVFMIAGNHDIGGWDDTPPPDGTARRNWWKFFGWRYLNDPPPGEGVHTQNYSFDYGGVALRRDRGLQQLRPLASLYVWERQLHRRPARLARRRHRNRLPRHADSRLLPQGLPGPAEPGQPGRRWVAVGPHPLHGRRHPRTTRSTSRRKRSATASVPCVS